MEKVSPVRPRCITICGATLAADHSALAYTGEIQLYRRELMST